MQGIVDSLRDFATDAVDGCHILNASSYQAMQATEMPQQAASSFSADARDVFERRALTRLATALAMTGNCESMRFITNLLDQV